MPYLEELTGQLLIASPHLMDPNFRQTVVLMVHGDQDGALGLILNRLSDSMVSDLWQAIFEEHCHTEQPLHVGGPVSGPLMAVHTHEQLADTEIIPGLYFSTRKEFLQKIVSEDLQPFKLFLGHSGWGEGQLKREMEEGAWLTTPATVDTVFGEESQLWQVASETAGRHILSSLLHLKHFPDDPSVN
jgi:putative transcriptional regulator